MLLGTGIMTITGVTIASQADQRQDFMSQMMQQMHQNDGNRPGQMMPVQGMQHRMGQGQGNNDEFSMMRDMMNMHGAQVPTDNPITPAKVALGKQLFYDARLSKDGTVSCNSCHDLAAAGADTTPVSTGVGDLQGERNAPTVWNSALHQAQFWDGRAESLEAQVKGPLVNPIEMAMPDLDAVEASVKAIPGYVSQFEAIFGSDSVNIDNIAKAVATFERTLVNEDSKFDTYRFSDQSVFSEQELAGLNTFTQAGCMQCHMGPDMAGPPPLVRGTGFYQEFPKFKDSLLIAKYKLAEDTGRYQTTHQESDRHVYRVPSLRNIKETAPYFHNGAVDTLEEAARVCAELQNDRQLNDQEISDITTFLATLSGEFPEQVPPVLP